MLLPRRKRIKRIILYIKIIRLIRIVNTLLSKTTTKVLVAHKTNNHITSALGTSKTSGRSYRNRIRHLLAKMIYTGSDLNTIIIVPRLNEPFDNFGELHCYLH
jgi:hypothetical protein